jgi:hypothetical protein
MEDILLRFIVSAAGGFLGKLGASRVERWIDRKRKTRQSDEREDRPA